MILRIKPNIYFYTKNNTYKLKWTWDPDRPKRNTQTTKLLQTSSQQTAADEMCEHIKPLTAKPANLRSISTMCTVKRQNWLPPAVLWLLHAHARRQREKERTHHKDTKIYKQDKWNVKNNKQINTWSEQKSQTIKGTREKPHCSSRGPGFDPQYLHVH